MEVTLPALFSEELLTLGGSSDEGEPLLTPKFMVELKVVVEPGERVSKSLLFVTDSLLCNNSNCADEEVFVTVMLLLLFFFFCCSTLFYTMRLISSFSMSGS